MKCKKHPRYQGKRRSRSQCHMCRRIFRAEEAARVVAKDRYNAEGYITWPKDLPSRDLIRPNTDLATRVEAMMEDFALARGENYGLDQEEREQIQFEADIDIQHRKELKAEKTLFMLTMDRHEKAPESVPIRGEIVALCKETGRAWGASFVCPWSHTAGRRLPRAWIAHRNHMDCLIQAEVL